MIYRIFFLVGLIFLYGNVFAQQSSTLEGRYREKLKIELVHKGEVMLYSKLRDEGLSHNQSLEYINANADVSVKCQIVSFTKLPSVLVLNILRLVDDGRTILEANRMAMADYKQDFLSSGKTEEDFLKYISSSGLAWKQCMSDSKLDVKNFIK